MSKYELTPQARSAFAHCYRLLYQLGRRTMIEAALMQQTYTTSQDVLNSDGVSIPKKEVLSNGTRT